MLIMEPVKWRELHNITGSRWLDGNVPNVNWNGNNSKVKVNWNNPSNRNDQLRLRSEVS